MPGPGEDYLVKPGLAPVTVSLEPAHNAINSLLLLREASNLSGLDDWVTRTAASLAPEEPVGPDGGRPQVDHYMGVGSVMKTDGINRPAGSPRCRRLPFIA